MGRALPGHAGLPAPGSIKVDPASSGLICPGSACLVSTPEHYQKMWPQTSQETGEGS